MQIASDIQILFSIGVLVMSIVIHEVSHGYVAYILGDKTAHSQGRLTLNPLKHLDPFGSIIFPLLSLAFGGFVIGWAKPVPYNPHNLRNKRFGELLVAGAGPAVNFFIAIVFGLVLRFSISFGSLTSSFFEMMTGIIIVNIALGLFNLMPIPPLDGSKILFSLLPFRYDHIRVFLERYSLIFVLFFAFFVWKFVMPLIVILYTLLTSVPSSVLGV